MQLDGFWERDEALQLLQACGRWLKHHIEVDDELPSDAGDAAAAGAVAPAPGADAGRGASTVQPAGWIARAPRVLDIHECRPARFRTPSACLGS